MEAVINELLTSEDQSKSKENPEEITKLIKMSQDNLKESSYRWSDEENLLFILNFHTYRRSWKLISDHQPGRDPTKCRTHGQKYILGLQKFKEQVDKVLAGAQAASSDFLVKLLKYEKERSELLKLYSLETADEYGRLLQPTFFPDYLIKDVKDSQKLLQASKESQIKYEFDVKLAQISNAILTEINAGNEI